jgi:hypothetical protein
MFRPAVPMKRVELPWLNVERSDGRSLSASPSETSPVSVSSPTSTDVSGTDESSVGREMREPVTTMERSVFSSESQMPLLLASTHSAAVSYAKAGWLTEIATANAAAPTSRCDLVIDNSPVARSKCQMNGLGPRKTESRAGTSPSRQFSYRLKTNS